MDKLKKEAEEILNLIKLAKTDQEFYDLGNLCDQLWKKHQANDKLNPWSSSFLSDCKEFCYCVPEQKNGEDREEEHNCAIGSMENYIGTFR
jgi:hypothetical protein